MNVREGKLKQKKKKFFLRSLIKSVISKVKSNEEPQKALSNSYAVKTITFLVYICRTNT